MRTVPNVEWAMPPVTGEGLAWGAGALAVGVLLGWVARLLVRTVMLARGRGESSAEVFGRLTSWLFGFLGIAAALTIVFPRVKPVDILSGVGVVSIAAGIAFQTVLGNMFAGIVILARDRFRVGDQIGVQDYRGTVTAIRLSSTSLRTFDGRLVLIPNSVMHSKIVTVQTGFAAVRTTVGLDVDEQADLDLACRVAIETMRALPEVIDEPAPEAQLASIGTATVHLELRFWSGARQLETREARATRSSARCSPPSRGTASPPAPTSSRSRRVPISLRCWVHARSSTRRRLAAGRGGLIDRPGVPGPVEARDPAPRRNVSSHPAGAVPRRLRVRGAGC